MKVFSLAMLLVSAMVGAGFASGREILSFFGSDIPFYIVPLCGVLIFGFSCLFLTVGKKVGAAGISEANHKILGRLHIAADAFLLFNALVVLSGMLAAMDSLFEMILPIAPAYSIISGILCALIVMGGVKGLLKGNLIIMPLVIVSIVTVCCFAVDSVTFSSSFRWFSLPAAVVYVSMNMMLACSVLTTVKNLTTRQIILSSAIAAVIISALLGLIVALLNGMDSHGAMPVLEAAQNRSSALFYVSVAAVAVSIFTTMMVAMSGLNQWLKGLVGGKKYSVALVLLAGLILSNLGFENVVSFLYPVIGGAGLIYAACCVVFLIKNRKKELADIQSTSPMTNTKLKIKERITEGKPEGRRL